MPDVKFQIRDEFETDAKTYWEVFFSDDYNARLWPHLNIDRELLEQHREGEGDDLIIRRKQRLTPRRELPAFMQKFVKGALAYTETNHFRAADNSMDVHTEPSVMADKITSRGVYRLEAVGDDKVARIYEGEVECRVPLVGKKVEKQIVDEVKETYRKATDFTRTYLATHGD